MTIKMNRRHFLKLAASALAALGLGAGSETQAEKMPVEVEATSKPPWWNPTGDCEPIIAWEAQVGWVYFIPGCLTAEQVLQVIENMKSL